MVDEGVFTAEEIARVAGVARGTISHWRRRHADFPAPVSGAGRGAVFDQAEVEAWLAGAGRCELAPNASLWREVSHAARGTSLGRVVAAVAAAVTPHADGQAPEHALPPGLARAAERSVDEAGAVAVLGDLIDRYSVASGRYVTPARIAEFMVSLAAIGEGATVLDPASGCCRRRPPPAGQGRRSVRTSCARDHCARSSNSRSPPAGHPPARRTCGSCDGPTAGPIRACGRCSPNPGLTFGRAWTRLSPRQPPRRCPPPSGGRSPAPWSSRGST